MMMLRMKNTGFLRDCADPSVRIRNVAQHQVTMQETDRLQNGTLIKVKAYFLSSPDPFECCVHAQDVESYDITAGPLSLWSFLKNCALAAKAINATDPDAPGVNVVYMVALAMVLNGGEIKNAFCADQDLKAFGPFQFTEDEWEKFRTVGNNAASCSTIDRFDPIKQCDAAAFVIFEAAREIRKEMTPQGASPYVPCSIDLFLYHMLGKEAAVAALKLDDAGRQATDLATIVTGNGPALVALKKRYPKFLDVAAAKTVQDVIKIIEDTFDKALEGAFKLIEKHTPEDLPMVAAGGTPPWLTVAREEEAKNIREDDSAGAAQIATYFDSTGFDTGTAADPWCGAFVAYCLSKTPPNPANVVASVKKASAATAASWKGWGDVELSIGDSNVPAGAVVVLTAVEKDRSGHVGFFVKKANSLVTLLGGNQSNTVKESSYPLSRVAAVRWLNWSGQAQGPVVNDTAGSVGPLSQTDWTKYCNVLGERESGNDYTKVNSLGYCGRWQFGALALIDRGYVRSGVKDNELNRPSSWTGTDGMSSRDAWLGSKPMQDNAMLAYTRANYKALVRLKILDSTSSVARVAGFLAAAHLGGAGGAKLLLQGQQSTDAFGTSTGQYFRLLSEAFGGAASP